MREHAAEGPATEPTDEPVVVALPNAVAAPLTPAGLLGIQRHAGNRAAAALVARAPTATATTLAIGATGSKVTSLQMHLNMLDEVKTELAVDAIFGPITQGAVRQFQSAHPPLKPTGAVDADTEAAIAEAGTEAQDQTEIARKLFALGAKAYERGKYGHAYAFFTRAGELAARPALLFSRAQALRKLGGRRKEAIALYEAYLLTDNPTRKADAEAGLAELKATPTGDEATDTNTGRTHFNKGAALYERGDYAHAADEFELAGEYADRPALLFSRAQALRKLGGRRDQPSPARPPRPTARFEHHRATSRSGPRRPSTPTPRRPLQQGRGAVRTGQVRARDDQFTMAGELADRPALLFSRAQALRKLGGRESEAIALYEQYIEAAGEGGNRVEDCVQMLELLRTHGAAP